MEHTYSDMKQKNLVLHRIKEVFENPVQVGIFDTDDERVSVETVKCLDCPFEGVTSYSTLGVYRCPNLLTADNKELNVKFTGICDSRNKKNEKNSSFHCEKSHRKYAGLYYSGGRRFYLPKFPLCKTYRATGRMAILIMEAAGFHNNIMQY